MKLRIDHITNSSSGCFVCCGEGLTVEGVREDLEKMLAFYNELFEDNKEFYDVFIDPVVADVADQARLNETLGFYGTMRDNIEGKIVIYSASDNSIPYAIRGIMDAKFNTYYVHFG